MLDEFIVHFLLYSSMEYMYLTLFFLFFFFFKQKTAYEMLRSLVGSEMCIRDSMTVVIEFFYIFESMWTHHTSIPFGMLYLTFAAMLVTVICCSVSFTYAQLSNENHRWWWFSLLSLSLIHI
eukprot:TRINITY_DN44390_c0_g1_i2.p1 TRINITY_DN44390_c0_g1~~TRINITY_DN44390_c0_g1_i2.p1  ORF type:complete len:122 (+),score=42.13 TRINITY_DN44390_c0_g1_i2:30-395(+)